MNYSIAINAEKASIICIGPYGFMLDVGCGDFPQGHVNCDLHQECLVEEYGYWQDRHMEPKQIPNFVQCDINHLPFRDNAFHIIWANQVLEHIPYYVAALQEMIRVASKLIYISVPAIELDLFPTHHFHFFHPRTFQNLITHLEFPGTLQTYHEFGEYIFLLEFRDVPIPDPSTTDGAQNSSD